MDDRESLSEFFSLFNEISTDLGKLESLTYTSKIFGQKEYLIDFPEKSYYPDLNKYISDNKLGFLTEKVENNESCEAVFTLFLYTLKQNEKWLEYLKIIQKVFPSDVDLELDEEDLLSRLLVPIHAMTNDLRDDFKNYKNYKVKKWENSSSRPENVNVVFQVLKRIKFGQEVGIVVLHFVKCNHGFKIESVQSELVKFSEHFNKYQALIVSRIKESLIPILRTYYRSQSIKSAMAAIMSRNGSHNLGSHVLSAVSTTDNDTVDDQYLFKYIQYRMDFVATITTEIPDWSFSAWFVADLMRHFYIQRQLLNFIAESEGLSAYEFQPESFEQKNKIVITVSKVNANGKVISIINLDDKDKSVLQNDIQVSITGGIVGYHAFYTILENIIRNSAKHSWENRKARGIVLPNNLHINVQIQEQPDKDYYIIKIWDNVSIVENIQTIEESLSALDPLSVHFQSLPLHIQQRYKFTRSFIDFDTGELKKENWGLAEIKICAGYMNMKPISEIGHEGDRLLFDARRNEDGFISAIAVKDSDNGKEAYRLGYEFPLPKPRELLIVGYETDDRVREKAKISGIYIKDTIESNADYDLVVLYDNGKNLFIETLKNFCETFDHEKLKTIVEDIEHFPFRLFIVSDKIIEGKLENDYLKKRLVLLTPNEFKRIVDAWDFERIKLELYWKWILHIKAFQAELQNTTSFNLLINTHSRETGGSDPKSIFEILYRRFKDDILSLLEKEYKDQNYDINHIKQSIEHLRRISWEMLLCYDTKLMGNPPKQSRSLFLNEERFTERWYILALDNADQSIPSDGYFKQRIQHLVEQFYDLTKRTFKKYEEDIQTLPRVLRANGDDGKSDWNRQILPLLKSKIGVFEDESQIDKCNIFYNRHDLIVPDSLIYSERLSGAQNYFNLLSHVPEDHYIASKIVLQLIENALLRLLVVDERVTEYLVKNSNLSEPFQYAKISVPTVVQRTNNSKYDDGDFVSLTQHIRIPNVEKDKKEYSEFVQKNAECGKWIILDGAGKNINGSKYDILLIHQGVLEKLIDTDKNRIEHFVRQLQKDIPFVIITSGRGSPSTLPDHVKFLPFSNLDSTLRKQYPEKFILTQLLMRIFAREKHG